MAYVKRGIWVFETVGDWKLTNYTDAGMLRAICCRHDAVERSVYWISLSGGNRLMHPQLLTTVSLSRRLLQGNVIYQGRSILMVIHGVVGGQTGARETYATRYFCYHYWWYINEAICHATWLHLLGESVACFHHCNGFERYAAEIKTNVELMTHHMNLTLQIAYIHYH